MRTTVINEIRRDQPGYPRRMSELGSMPKKLYIIGNLPPDDVPAAAVVGARMCSGYGKDTAYQLGRFLGRRGISVISGMAVGIDGYAQSGALDAGGLTYAVLASGPDVCYPRTNADLYDRIRLSGGGILSEHEAGVRPLGPYFPSRNRIISALSDIVVIVEARERSGSLITADFALEQGKTIYAVPGRICDDLSAGCNRLIDQGAMILTSPDALLYEFERLAGIRNLSKPVKNVPLSDALMKEQIEENAPLSKEARQILNRLHGSDEVSADVLAGQLNIPVPLAAGALMELSFSGLAEEIGRGRFRRKSIRPGS